MFVESLHEDDNAIFVAFGGSVSVGVDMLAMLTLSFAKVAIAEESSALAEELLAARNSMACTADGAATDEPGGMVMT